MGGWTRGVMALPGAKLILPIEATFPNMFEEVRCTVDGRPRSARLLPDEDRWKEGCCGRLGASDIRDEETERA